MQSTGKHSAQITLTPSDISPEGYLEIPSLCRHMESTATEHAAILDLSIERLRSLNTAWVLAKMQMEVGSLFLPDNKYTLYTWPVKIDKLQFRRDFMAINGRGEIIAKALTQWVIVNLNTRRAARIPAFIAELHPVDPEYALAESDWKIPAQAESPRLKKITVAAEDIDRNNHANNVRFIHWLMDCLPENEKSHIHTLEAIFRAEALKGDHLTARGKTEDNTGRVIALYREPNAQELFRGRLTFK